MWHCQYIGSKNFGWPITNDGFELINAKMIFWEIERYRKVISRMDCCQRMHMIQKCSSNYMDYMIYSLEVPAKSIDL